MPSSTSHAREIFASIRLPGKVWIGSAPAEPIRRLATGVGALDDLLDGGLPRGHLSEVTGAPSSGRTALAYAFLAAATRRGELAAVIDLPDALDPATLQAAGADLQRILWVRPPELKSGFKCAEILLSTHGFGLVVLDLTSPVARRSPLHVWPRLARAAEKAGTALVLLGHRRLAGSFATLGLVLTLRRVLWTPPLLDGLATRALVAKSRMGTPGRGVPIAFGIQPSAFRSLPPSRS